jgi:hypothetical protein
MYDRVLSMGQHEARPILPGGPTVSTRRRHVSGGPVLRKKT